MSWSARWPGSRVPEALLKRQYSSLSTQPGAGSAICTVASPEDLPSCETGPLGRCAFVFREILAMVRGGDQAGEKR